MPSLFDMVRLSPLGDSYFLGTPEVTFTNTITRKYIPSPSSEKIKYINDPSSFININDKHECSICMEHISKYKLGITNCNHIFCLSCLEIQMTKYNNKCALCRKSIYKIKVCDEPIMNVYNNSENKVTNYDRSVLLKKLREKCRRK